MENLGAAPVYQDTQRNLNQQCQRSAQMQERHCIDRCSHSEGKQDLRHHIFYLLKITVIEKLLVWPRIDDLVQNRCHQKTICHCLHTDPHGNQDCDNADCFFDDLQLQKQIAPPHGFDRIQVCGMYGIKCIGNTKDS